MTRALRTTLADVEYALGMARISASYWIRPYDPHLDARRWRWTTSGRQRSYAVLNGLTAAERADLIAALSRALARRRPPTDPTS